MKPIFIIFCLSLLSIAVALFSLPVSRSSLKSSILSLADRTNRGLNETEEEKKEMLILFEKLEKLSSTKNTLKDPNTSGLWDLKYTTSSSILGRGGFARIGPILQKIDVKNLMAENSEIVDYGLVKVLAPFIAHKYTSMST